jgi:hypothetical protein
MVPAGEETNVDSPTGTTVVEDGSRVAEEKCGTNEEPGGTAPTIEDPTSIETACGNTPGGTHVARADKTRSTPGAGHTEEDCGTEGKADVVHKEATVAAWGHAFEVG